MLEYLKIMEYELIKMLSTPTIIRNVKNSNYMISLKKYLLVEIHAALKQFLILLNLKC